MHIAAYSYTNGGADSATHTIAHHISTHHCCPHHHNSHHCHIKCHHHHYGADTCADHDATHSGTTGL